VQSEASRHLENEERGQWVGRVEEDSKGVKGSVRMLPDLITNR
jgi:hypothetical protein